jgi:hypothetical protein
MDIKKIIYSIVLAGASLGWGGGIIQASLPRTDYIVTKPSSSKSEFYLKKMDARRQKSEQISKLIEEISKLPYAVIMSIVLPYLRDGFTLTNSFGDIFSVSEHNTKIVLAGGALTVDRTSKSWEGAENNTFSVAYDIYTAKLLFRKYGCPDVPEIPQQKDWGRYPSPSDRLTTVIVPGSAPRIETSADNINLLRDAEGFQPSALNSSSGTVLVAYSPDENAMATYNLAFGGYVDGGKINVYEQLDEDIIVKK